ncbi:hypothetical protein NDU88_000717 [Pleurodeles waltl]|uniref:Vesicle transport protein n=1 Tax=Pleurodeles waltl TaxID=8319 RepID=A0AAV7M628_PLEWA|nr:hypothetical protein NDU88_000717 [Pleurodeles waltl]
MFSAQAGSFSAFSYDISFDTDDDTITTDGAVTDGRQTSSGVGSVYSSAECGSCFSSDFALFGCRRWFLFFLFTGIAYIFRPNVRFVDPLKEKLVVGLFFLGVTLCLFFSWLFHTVSCRSQKVALMFSK